MTQERFFDFFVLPFVVAYFAFEPNFLRGPLLYLESGWYASAVNEIFRGKLIDRDFYFLYGPLSAYGPAFLMLAFGKSLAALRAYFLFSDIASFLVIFAICRALISNRFFSYFAAIVCVMDAHHPNWSSRWGGPRLTMGYLALLGIVLFCHRRQKRYLVMAGIFSMLCFLHGYDLGIFSFLSVALFFSFSKEFRKREFIFSYFAGLSFILLPFTASLVVSGGFFPFMNHLASLGATAGLAQPFDLGNRSVLKFIYPAIPYLAAILFYRRDRALLVSVVYGIFLYLYSFRAPQGPQFEASLPLAIASSFYLYEKIFKHLKGFGFSYSISKKALGRTVLAVLLVAGVAYNLFSQKRFYHGNIGWWAFYQAAKFDWMKDPDLGIVQKDRLKLSVVGGDVERAKGLWLPPDQAKEIEETVSFVKTKTREDEALFAFPDIGTFNFLCDRPSVGHFPISGSAHLKKEWAKEQLKALEREKPRLVVLNAEMSDLNYSVGLPPAAFLETYAWIFRHYRLVKSAGTIQIYERN